MKMNALDLNHLHRSAVGFDRFARMIDDALHSGETQPSYPPYNIVRIEENRYRIVMALAGFDRKDLDIVVEGDALKVAGRRRKDDTQVTYLHRGIAERDFEHRFRLADHVKPVAATMENGLLKIDLVREIPEVLKPRKLEIGGGSVDVIENDSARSAPATTEKTVATA
jgi:molecular chaperone IbpA